MVISDKIRDTIGQLSDSMPSSTPKVEIRAWKSVHDNEDRAGPSASTPKGPSTSGKPGNNKPEVPSKPQRGPLTPTTPTSPGTSTATPIIYAVPIISKPKSTNISSSSAAMPATSGAANLPNKPSISAPIMTSTTSNNYTLGPLEKSVPAPVTKSMPSAYAVSNISAPLLASAGSETKQNNLNAKNNSTRSRRTDYDSYNGSSWSKRRDNTGSPSIFKQFGGLSSKCSKNVLVLVLAIVCILQFIALIVIMTVLFGGNGDRGAASITYSQNGRARPGEVIFQDDFSGEELDAAKWRHERYLTEDGFVIYGTSEKNSYIEDGMLHIQPTYTVDDFNKTFMDYGTLEIGKTIEKSCSSFYRARCLRSANGGSSIINPIRSAILKTSQSFFFKYGTIEFRAKMPKGDWITTEISLRPRYEFYGEPTDSARIVITTSRGNEDYQAENRTHFGQERVCSQLIYSDSHATAVTSMVQFCHNTGKGEGLGEMFHDYKFTWEPDVMRLYIDEIAVGKFVDAMFAPSADASKQHIAVTGDEKTKRKNSFDQPFYIEIKVSVGTGFPEHNMYSPYRKPWVNNREDAPRAFWASKQSWEQSWTNNSALVMDYFTVRAQ